MNAIDIFRKALDNQKMTVFYSDHDPCVAIVNDEMFAALKVECNALASLKSSKSHREKFKRRNGRATMEIMGVAIYCSGSHAFEIAFGYAKDPCE